MNVGAAGFRVLFAVLLLIGTGTLSAQSDIDIQKFTNGQDADSAPGPVVSVGSTVTWTYVVTNTGGRGLTNIGVTDDQGVTVSCPATILDAGFSLTCTASGTAVPGQYVNVGTVTATRADSTMASASDPSHYFGQSMTSVTIEKRTNGAEADTPPGPSLPIGSAVNWTYEVTNAGNEALENIVVTDDRGVTVSCPATTLAIGASMICTASGIAQSGQYANIGSVSATRSVTLDTIASSDPSHYFGQTLRLTKATNGIESETAPGPTLPPGSTVTWTYEVTNPGPATVTGLTVTDDQGVVVTCAQTTIAAGESVTCSGNGTVQPGQYMNTGTATATLPAGGMVSATDSSFYFGNWLGIEKLTNGVDADAPPGPSITTGNPVNWTYVVTNYGPDALTSLMVSDDQGVVVTCPGSTIASGASMTCTASGVAAAGQYANIGTAIGTSATLGPLSASDPSHYFGQTAILDFGDAPDPTYATLFASNGARHVVGGAVYLGACVDAEGDAFASAAADGDDTNSGTATGTCVTPGDDEDGVSFTSIPRPGQSASADVVASAPCTLSAWIDFDGDGDFSDPGDALFAGGTPLAAGTNPVTFTVPATATSGLTFARFRCTTDGASGFTGQAADGEVEDYAIDIAEPLPAVSATKDDALLNDANGDSLPGPGDTLRYTVVITNSGAGDATGVFFNDSPDPNTSLVNGSVTTSSGSVTSGNTIGDAAVAVAVGTIAGPGSVTITFDVVIDDPLPASVTSVSNQGTVSGSNFAGVATDDATQPGSSDATPTLLAVPPAITATKGDALSGDADGDGQADPGDTLLYTIVITNSGSGDAAGVVFSDTPGTHTALIAGSVTTTAGSVASGNGGGDASVTVNVGTIADGGGSVTITFQVTIDDPLPPGVTEVSNQGTVSGSNFTGVSTDDPANGGPGDPTVTPIAAAAAVAAIPTLETWSLFALLAILSGLALRKVTG